MRTGLVLLGGQPDPGNPVVYAPRWKSDHHPWLTRGMDPKDGIRYANYEVREDQESERAVAKFNPTASQDGITRVDVRVMHRISRADIVSILEEYAANVADLDTDELSARQVMDVVREELRFHGTLAEGDGEPASDAERAWAERHAAKVWPRG